ncbi:MAG: hypothetical protein ABII12_06810 [Planctomycetota bacterium]
MGWGRTLLLGDIGNRLDIADTERDIGALKQELGRKRQLDQSQDQAIRVLQKENEELKLYLASLLRLLVSKQVLSREELSSFVRLIDE